ncbi:VanZ family protein [Jeotgalibacillus proteolyticus]|uniref:VanZ-like domain-containing protein n=1 Tax=Jeotgalibacillus proteolyticus TaxID=2082395 RepID=A0A2S5G993_9BACL|nr:VanZ family protein [Jeotgalibacillus proteolyticus]PPA69491.1 hypothetical protein C4B60_13130 [Jeotgalibacillus proteolyticus]
MLKVVIEEARDRLNVTPKGIFIRLLPMIIFMGLVVYSSSQTYEQQTIVPLLDRLLAKEFFKDQLMWVDFTYSHTRVSIENQGYSGFVEFILRKFAHLSLFFVISVFLCSFIYYLFRDIGIAVACTFIFIVCFAALDEFHQYVTGGRTPLVQDVVLDTVGGTLGIIFYILWRMRKTGKGFISKDGLRS